MKFVDTRKRVLRQTSGTLEGYIVLLPTMSSAKNYVTSRSLGYVAEVQEDYCPNITTLVSRTKQTQYPAAVARLTTCLRRACQSAL